MRERLRAFSLALMIGALALACVSVGLPEGATPTHRYYAALADYNQTKRVVLVYVSAPETSLSSAQAVAEIVEATDLQIRYFEAIRRTGGSSDSQYETVATILEAAAAGLRVRIGDTR